MAEKMKKSNLLGLFIQLYCSKNESMVEEWEEYIDIYSLLPEERQRLMLQVKDNLLFLFFILLVVGGGGVAYLLPHY